MAHPVVIVIVLGVAIFLAVLWWWLERKRQEAFRRSARKLGLRYVSRDRALPRRYSFLNALRKGSNRYAFNILRGTYGGYPVQVFDYHYQTRSRNSDHHEYFSFFLLEQERYFPELRIYPEDLGSRLGQMLGFKDIDFESVEFSRAFVVRSRDRKFAYDVCHTRMMEYLLEHRDVSLEIEGRCIAMGFPKRLRPDEIPGRLQQLVEIRQLFPEYLYRE